MPKKKEEEIKREPVTIERPARETPETKKVIDQIVTAVRKKFGDEAIQRLGEVEDVIGRFSTGISSLDAILGGGFPLAKLVQITGAESVGKTTLCNFLAARAQHEKIGVQFIDGEDSEEKDRAESIGVNPDLLTISEPETLQDAFMLMDTMIEHLKKVEEPSLIMLDSVAAFPTKEDLERGFDELGRSGVRASFLSANLPKLVRPLKGSMVGIIFVNQIRDRVRAAPFEKPTYSPGGRALRHWCHLTLELKRIGQVKEKGVVVGIRTKIRVEKTKITGIRPYATAGVKIYFDGRVVEDTDEGEME